MPIWLLRALCHDPRRRDEVEQGTSVSSRPKQTSARACPPCSAVDLLIVNQDYEGASFIVALDRKTGEEKWRAKRDEATSWATPLAIERGGKREIVVSATKRVRCYDAADGALLWKSAALTTTQYPVPVTDGNTVFCMSGFRAAHCWQSSFRQPPVISRANPRQ